MIQPKKRNCTKCKKEFVGNTKLCSSCTTQNKITKEKSKPKKEIDLEKLKGKNNQVGKSKRVKSQEELDLEKKNKLKETERKAKERSKNRRESKKLEKQISMTHLQELHQKYIRLVAPITCASCGKITTTEKGGSMSTGGHMIEKGRCKSTALLMTNLYNQCWSCNSKNIGNGRPLDLYKYGCNFWGQEQMDLVVEIAKISYSFDKGERLEIYQEITQRIKDIESRNNLSDKDKKHLLKDYFNWQQSQLWYKFLLDSIK